MKRIRSLLCLLMCVGSSYAQFVPVPDSALRWCLRYNAPSAFNGNLMDTTNSQLQALSSLNYSGNVPMVNFEGLQFLHGLSSINFLNVGADSMIIFPPNLTGFSITSTTLKRIYNIPNSVWAVILNGHSPLNYIDIPSFTNTISLTIDHAGSLNNRNTVINFHAAYYSGRTVNATILSADTVVFSGAAPDVSISGSVNGKLDLSAVITNNLFTSANCNILLLPPLCSEIKISGTVDSLNAWPSDVSTLILVNGNDDGLKLKKGIPPSVHYFNGDGFLLGELDSIPSGLLNFKCINCHLSRLPDLPASLLTLEVPFNYLPCFPWLPDGLTNFVYQPQYLPDNTIAPFYCLPNWPLPWAFNHPNGFIGCPPTLSNCHTISAIEGKVYLDIDSNGVKSSAEPYLPNIRMKTKRSGNPQEYISVTGDSGNFFQYAIPGSHTVEPILPRYHYLSSSITNVIIADFGDTMSVSDVGIYRLSNINDLFLSAVISPWPRPGFNSTLYITCINNGTKVSNGSVHFDIDPVFTINSTTPVADTLTGSSIAWNITGMLPGAVYSYSVSLTCLPSTPLNSIAIIDGIAYPVYSDTFPSDNFEHLMLEIRGSKDPNDKQASPADFFTPVQVNQGDVMDYTIRFQNTGTAEAVHIEIADSLSSLFDISSLEVISASHQPYTWRIQDQTLIVRFDSIMLPDSISNEPLSHGYVHYRVKPLSSVQTGNVLENNADIYFDFNAPVRTNTTATTIGWPSGIHEFTQHEQAVVYPNPVYSGENYLYLKSKAQEPLIVQWNDQAGRLIYTDRIPAYENTIPLPRLSPGVYFMKLTGTSGVWKYIKVVVPEE